MLLDDADVVAVLRTLYRVRSATVRELASLDSLPKHRLDEILARLRDAGYLLLDGDRVTPVPPDTVIAAAVTSAFESQRTALADSAALLSTLPMLARDWEVGESGAEYALSAEIIHGHRAQWEAWGRYATELPTIAPISLYPDLAVLENIVAPDAVRMRNETGVHTPLRAILPAAVCADPRNERTLALLAEGGVRVRTLASVPHMMYVDDGVYAALPLTWNEHPPNSLILIRQPSVVSALAYVAEVQWKRAVPLSLDDEGWDAVLQLLAQGMSDKAIAVALGSSMRTVQRRITEAMQALGASTRFELGAAYARRQAARG